MDMKWISSLFWLPLFFSLLIYSSLALANGQKNPTLPLDPTSLDLYCLKLSYPQIKKIRDKGSSKPLLELENGQLFPYHNGPKKYLSALEVDLAESMAQVYPLEPQRPLTPQGFAPGRKRPYAFLESLYGADKTSVQKKLIRKKFLSSNLSLHKNAAQAFSHAENKLLQLARSADLAEYLKPEGAFYWRVIAGEKVPSAHSWGIALDLGLKKSPYWRWSKERPHPKQQSYPSILVQTMEEHGFIWGGKWHEYDLMHYEYRPELICKARMLQLIKGASAGKFTSYPLKAGKPKSSVN